jgi:hypothetical protein
VRIRSPQIYVLLLVNLHHGRWSIVANQFKGTLSSGVVEARSYAFEKYWEVEDLLRTELPDDMVPLRRCEGIQIQQYFSELWFL